ncbi:MAG: AbrB/MazE/SpoVT family DNA-binding domain-containing protein [Archaeoglobales archaeon]|nr:AbrB/MazE/SpoVT family DNA-binding domain-containing protein [Archaeoglobales archaeon]MDI9642892.1 AbrB/MazE/SpoVT family DNA-binding domain-containing protein [Archaeoglobales archaeon]
MGIEIKKMDRHGRIVIPKKWREKIGEEVILVMYEDKLEILPKKGNLLRFLDSVEVEELREWERMRKELYEIR